MRERLIELMNQAETRCANTERCVDCEYNGVDGCMAYNIVDHLLAEGVIVLPCKVGQTVWFISEFYTQPFQTVITSIEVYEEETVICTLSGTEWHYEDFGKTVFLTKEEAENALAEREGKG